MSDSAASTEPVVDMVVVQFGHSLLKGHTQKAAWSPAALGQDGLSPPIIPLGETELKRIALESAKAAFFVRSFEGKGLNPIQFHGQQSHKDALWVRAIFHDGEIVEGMLENSKELLLHSTLSIIPYDPEGNNLLMVFAKTQLAEFHVLGVRSSS